MIWESKGSQRPGNIKGTYKSHLCDPQEMAGCVCMSVCAAYVRVCVRESKRENGGLCR
uniref:Uncharacterized protein n=1 Tax=Anguilla anguilla TaxID=7936 RepID=A0A0E9WNL5_ANGAN